MTTMACWIPRPRSPRRPSAPRSPRNSGAGCSPGRPAATCWSPNTTGDSTACARPATTVHICGCRGCRITSSRTSISERGRPDHQRAHRSVGPRCGSRQDRLDGYGSQGVRRLGLVRQPWIVVPNHIVDQVGREAQQWFPAARILLASAATTAKGRRRLVAQSAASQGDMVIVPTLSVHRDGSVRRCAHGLYQRPGR